MSDRTVLAPRRQIWITQSHLLALGVTTVAIALLSFFVGLEVGRGDVQAPIPPTLALLPDASSDAALEALLREVEAAQGAEGLTFPDVLPEPVAPQIEPVEVPAVVTTVVEPISKEPAPAPPSSGWAVQVASYHTQAEADQRVGELIADGVNAYAVAAMVAGRTWFRVRVGGFADKPAAEQGRVGLQEQLGLGELMIAPAP